MYLGQQYFGLGQMEKSKQEFLTVLQIEPNYEPAFAALALTYSDAGELPEAQLALESAIKSNSKNYNIWLQYIGVRQAMGASNEELGQLYEDALLATSRYTDILTKYAQFEESVGNIAEAIALWEEALKNYPENAQFYNTEINRLKKLK